MLKIYKPTLFIGSARPRPALIEFISFPHQAADFLGFIHGNPSRVPVFLTGMNLSIPCSSPVANLSHMLCTEVVARSDCLSST